MIYIKTYGCTFNKSDSQTMSHLLEGMVTNSLSLADTVIFNTCGVKGQTEHKVLKDIASVLGSKKVIVAGCLPFISPDAIPEQVDAIIGPDQIPDILQIVGDVAKGKRVRRATTHSTTCPKLLPHSRTGATAIIPISLGCRGACAYCATRFARGELRSYRPDEILSEISRLIEGGFKEFQLTSQDTGCYGLDIGTDLPSLLSGITRLEGNFRVRVGMMNPNHAHNMLDGLLDAYDSDKVFKFLHLPVQSGSDAILRDMNRFYATDAYFEVVEEFRQRFPDLYLATDVIVGFPGETEEDLLGTADLIMRSKPDKVNITRFSARPMTPAAQMRQYPDRIKKDRSRILSRLVHKISHEINLRYVGKTVEVLVLEGGKKGRMVGRMGNYKPVICDGAVGEFKKVDITSATSTYLVSR